MQHQVKSFSLEPLTYWRTHVHVSILINKFNLIALYLVWLKLDQCFLGKFLSLKLSLYFYNVYFAIIFIWRRFRYYLHLEKLHQKNEFQSRKDLTDIYHSWVVLERTLKSFYVYLLYSLRKKARVILFVTE